MTISKFLLATLVSLVVALSPMLVVSIWHGGVWPAELRGSMKSVDYEFMVNMQGIALFLWMGFEMLLISAFLSGDKKEQKSDT